MKNFIWISLFTIYLGFAASFAYLLFTFLPSAHADFNLGVFPPIIEIKAKPPANVSTLFEVQNLGNDTVTLQIILKPFVASDQENGQVKYLNEVPPEYSSLFQRVRIFLQNTEIKEISLGPKQKKELALNIHIPRDSAVQDYYFSIVFISLPSQTKDRNVTQSLGGLATNVLLSVGSTGIASGVIAEFSFPIFIEKGPVPFTVRVKNTSNHFLAPKGEIIIKNLLGEEVGRVNLLPVNILAKSVRSIPSDTSDTFSAKGGPASGWDTSFAYWNERFVIGPYRATLNIVLSDSGPQFSREIIFFGFPYGSFIAIIGSFITLFYIASRVKRKI